MQHYSYSSLRTLYISENEEMVDHEITAFLASCEVEWSRENNRVQIHSGIKTRLSLCRVRGRLHKVKPFFQPSHNTLLGAGLSLLISGGKHKWFQGS